MIGTFGYVFDRSLSFIIYRGQCPEKTLPVCHRLPPFLPLTPTLLFFQPKHLFLLSKTYSLVPYAANKTVKNLAF